MVTIVIKDLWHLARRQTAVSTNQLTEAATATGGGGALAPHWQEIT